MKINKFNQQDDFLAFVADNPVIREHIQFETHLCSHHANEDYFLLAGYCKAGDKPTNFSVDKLAGAQMTEQG